LAQAKHHYANQVLQPENFASYCPAMPQYPRLDSHQHFWRYDPIAYPWISDSMGILKRDFLPKDLAPLLASVDFQGSIAVQARQSIEETEWLLELSNQFDSIRGVVGWVDLRSTALEAQLSKYSAHSKFRGVRHVVQDEPDDDFLLRPDFQQGVQQLRRFNLTYDLLIFPRQLPAAIALVEALPQQPFVLDHIAKPAIREGQLEPWKTNVERLARAKNVYCKLSGMVTEAVHGKWQPHHFHRYLDIVIGAFGSDRVMIGSDWPVCLLSGDYQRVQRIVLDYIKQFPVETQSAITGGNCSRFYGI
jgi:L-fuconolactonase